MRTILILLFLIIIFSLIGCQRPKDWDILHAPPPEPCECTCNETWEFDTPILDEYEESRDDEEM